jgi:hypothetical protein
LPIKGFFSFFVWGPLALGAVLGDMFRLDSGLTLDGDMILSSESASSLRANDILVDWLAENDNWEKSVGDPRRSESLLGSRAYH